MKYVYLVCLLLIPGISFGQGTVYKAWFSHASITGAVQLSTPSGAPILVTGGTSSACLDMTSSVGMAITALNQKSGSISFWLRPKWDGNDGLYHKFVTVGNPFATSDGLLIDKTAANNMRFLMAGGGKVTAVRTDISKWQTGEWHHVMVSWLENNGAPLGLAMWIDRVPVASCVYGGTEFMTPPADKKVYVGDTTSQAYMDEFLYRDSMTSDASTPTAYIDYYRTAPYTSIQITHKPQHVNADQRVVAGYKKQFGVIATKTVNAITHTTTTEYITDSDGPPSSTTDAYDAKPYITWTSSSTSKATVNSSGLVTGVATTTTPITLTAKFRGLTATYPLSVISSSSPDLDVMYVERTPRYHANATKNWPDIGETCTSTVHIGNFGYITVLSGTTVKFELITDSNKNFKIDPEEEAAAQIQTASISTSISPGSKQTVAFTWKWPETQTFIRVTVDPDNKISEISEANNQRCELNIARAVRWGFGRDAAGNGNSDANFVNDYRNKVMNLTGSFSDYDWCNANTDRMDMILREAVHSTTTPDGIQDSVRADDFMTYDDYMIDHNDPQGALHDGGYEEMWDTRMTLSPGNIHEMGHNVLRLPDIYGHGIYAKNIFLKDENGKPYNETPLIPTIRDFDAPWSSATWGYPDALGLGYTPLMVNNHPWLEAHCAGWVQKFRQTRKGASDGNDDYRTYIPTNNSLKILDVNDVPLKNARVYVYQLANTWYIYMPNKYYSDRPKFIGSTDETGIYTFPKKTCSYWDDYNTSYVDGEVACETPFDIYSNYYHRITVNSPSWQSGEILLLKIVGENNQVEFQSLPASEFYVAYFSGNTTNATYTIKTSLTSPTEVPEVVPPSMPAGGSKPTALVKYDNKTYSSDFTITVYNSNTQSNTITLDGSISTDPENSPLYYRWDGEGGSTMDAVRQVTIPQGAGENEYQCRFFVIDGVCASDLRTITVKATAAPPPPPPTVISGVVTNTSGLPVSGAIVGLKKTPLATADAEAYAVTDANGAYSMTLPAIGAYYLAAWADGWTPTADEAINIQAGTNVTRDFRFARAAGANVVLCSPSVTASSLSYSGPEMTVDGNTSYGWSSDYYKTDPAYYYIDLRRPTDISDLVMYRQSYSADYYDDYSIDIMTDGDPLIGTSWKNNPTVRTVYSAEKSKHGYRNNYSAVNAIPLTLTGVRGIRISLKNTNDYRYEISEIQVHDVNNQAPIIISGRAVDSSGYNSYSRICVKTSPKATADVLGCVSSSSDFKIGAYPGETFYVAAWPSSYYQPSEDVKVTASNTNMTMPNLLIERNSTALNLSGRVSASSTATDSSPDKAIDGNSNTGWRSADTIASEPVYYYIDLGQPTNVGNILINAYLKNTDTVSTCDNYQIDVMTNGTPSDANSWVNNPSVRTIYSATKTMHGIAGVGLLYSSFDTALSALRLSPEEGAGVVGIRITFKNSILSPASYELRELAIYPVIVPTPVATIANLKGSSLNMDVIVRGKKLTYVPGGLIPGEVAYIEEPNRFSGVQLDLSQLSNLTCKIGDEVDVTGTLVMVDNEVRIKAKDLRVTSSGDPLKPLLMITPTLGGGYYGNQCGVWSWVRRKNSQGQYVRQFEYTKGVNNIGLLVKVCGKVTQIDPNGQYFYIDDGANVIDGSKTGTVENVGVRVALDGTGYTKGQFLIITGISSCYRDTDYSMKKLLRPISIQ